MVSINSFLLKPYPFKLDDSQISNCEITHHQFVRSGLESSYTLRGET
jgi:hypothetical protein